MGKAREKVIISTLQKRHVKNRTSKAPVKFFTEKIQKLWRAVKCRAPPAIYYYKTKIQWDNVELPRKVWN